MRTSVLILIAMLGVMPAYATTMCVKNDVVSVVLDPAVAGTNYTYNAANATWRTDFPYGTVSGISACLSVSGSYAVANPNLNATGGETDGLYCWCKMTHPVWSSWVFSIALSSVSNCASNCSRNCGYTVRSTSDFRVALVGSVGL